MSLEALAQAVVEVDEEWAKSLCVRLLRVDKVPLPFGTVDEVRDHVNRVIRELAPGGGYIFAINDIRPEVPPQNTTAAFKTAQDFGTYPIP